MPLRQSDVWGLLGSALLGFAINRVAKKFGPSDNLIGSPRSEPAPKMRHTMIADDARRWSYHVALFYQWTFFPGLLIYAWGRQDFRTEWLDLPWRSMNAVRCCDCDEQRDFRACRHCAIAS
jgi:hypothetical protein